MERETVDSSNIASMGYNPESETLEIEFVKSGKVYEYYNVPLFMFERLRDAHSIGRFFNSEIKNSYACSPL
jgi:hypothetical protein